MKSSTGIGIAATALFAVLAVPVKTIAQQSSATYEGPGPKGPTRYRIVDLGAVGSSPGQPYGLTNHGLIVGAAAASANVMHAVLWYHTLKIDIGARGLGGPNSAAFGVNELGQIVGAAETSTTNNEDFCGFNAWGFPSLTVCLPFVWQFGHMSPLPTLGGANGQALAINDRGEVAGMAETTYADPNPDCAVSQFKPVIWNRGEIHELPTYPGDADGIPVGINDKGQVVGGSGACGAFNAASGFYFVDYHALLWRETAPTAIWETSAGLERPLWGTSLSGSITAVRWLVIRTCPTTRRFTPSCGPKTRECRTWERFPGTPTAWPLTLTTKAKWLGRHSTRTLTRMRCCGRTECRLISRSSFPQTRRT